MMTENEAIKILRENKILVEKTTKSIDFFGKELKYDDFETGRDYQRIKEHVRNARPILDHVRKLVDSYQNVPFTFLYGVDPDKNRNYIEWDGRDGGWSTKHIGLFCDSLPLDRKEAVQIVRDYAHIDEYYERCKEKYEEAKEIYGEVGAHVVKRPRSYHSYLVFDDIPEDLLVIQFDFRDDKIQYIDIESYLDGYLGRELSYGHIARTKVEIPDWCARTSGGYNHPILLNPKNLREIHDFWIKNRQYWKNVVEDMNAESAAILADEEAYYRSHPNGNWAGD